MALAAYTTNFAATCDRPTFLHWDVDTLNTPYKHGLTSSTLGFGIVYGSFSGGYISIALAQGTRDIFVRSSNNGVDNGWTKVLLSQSYSNNLSNIKVKSSNLSNLISVTGSTIQSGNVMSVLVYVTTTGPIPSSTLFEITFDDIKVNISNGCDYSSANFGIIETSRNSAQFRLFASNSDNVASGSKFALRTTNLIIT